MLKRIRSEEEEEEEEERREVQKEGMEKLDNKEEYPIDEIKKEECKPMNGMIIQICCIKSVPSFNSFQLKEEKKEEEKSVWKDINTTSELKDEVYPLPLNEIEQRNKRRKKMERRKIKLKFFFNPYKKTCDKESKNVKSILIYPNEWLKLYLYESYHSVVNEKKKLREECKELRLKRSMEKQVKEGRRISKRLSSSIVEYKIRKKREKMIIMRILRIRKEEKYVDFVIYILLIHRELIRGGRGLGTQKMFFNLVLERIIMEIFEVVMNDNGIQFKIKEDNNENNKEGDKEGLVKGEEMEELNNSDKNEGEVDELDIIGLLLKKEFDLLDWIYNNCIFIENNEVKLKNWNNNKWKYLRWIENSIFFFSHLFNKKRKIKKRRFSFSLSSTLLIGYRIERKRQKEIEKKLERCTTKYYLNPLEKYAAKLEKLKNLRIKKYKAQKYFEKINKIYRQLK